MNSEKIFASLLTNISSAFALHRIITDENGKPINYEFIDVNDNFEDMAGISREKCIGKTVRDIIPDIEQSEFDWIGAYGDVALNQTKREFTQYSPPLGKWFRVSAFSPEKYYFITLFEVIDYDEDLKKLTERLELAMDAGEYGYWDYHFDTGVSYFSSGYYSMLGYEDKELPMAFDTFRDLLHPEDREDSISRIVDSLNNQISCDIEFRLRCKDGSYKWIQGRSKSYEFDNEGKPHRALGVHYDIDKRKKAEERLRYSEIKYRELIELARTVILQMDTDGTITFINEYGLQLFGFSKDELLGKNVVGTIVPEVESSGRDLLALVNIIKNDPKKFSYNENENITKDNKRLWIAWTNRVIENENGDIESILAFGTDITQRKKKEEELENFFDINLDLLCIADLDGKFLKVNKSWETTLGYSIDFLEKSKFLDFVHPDDKQKTLDAMAKLGNKNEVIGFVNRYMHKDGSVRFIEWKSIPSENLIFAAARDITERLKQEEYLKDRDATFSKLTNQVPGVIFQYQMFPDGSSCFPFSSEGMHDIYEVNPDQVKEDASLAFERIHKDDSDQITTSINESYRTLRVWSCEYRVMLPSKGLRWLSGIARPELQSDGSVIWNGYIHDITDRKLVEDKLKESEEKFSKIGNSALDAVIMINDNGAIEYWNPSAERIFGYKAGDVTGKDLHDLLMPDLYRDQYEKGWKHFPMTGKGNAVGKVVQLTAIRSNGEYFPIEIALSSVQIKGRYWASAYIRDITDRKKAEEELLESKQQFELAVNGTNDGIWDWDIRDNNLFLSKRWKEMLGYQEHELENKFDTFVNLVYKDDQSKVSQYIQKYLNGEIEKYEIELRMIHKDGTPRWILAKGEALRTEEGFPYRMAGSHSDITRRKLQEEKIKHQNAYIESILEAIPDLMFVLDSKGIFTDIKVGHEDELFLPREQFIGKNIQDVLPEPISTKVLSSISRLINGKKVRPIQYKLPMKDEIRDYEARLTLAGENSFISMVRDITDQKTAERELKRQFELQDLLMNIAAKYINIPLSEYQDTIKKSLHDLGMFTNADRAYIFDYDWDNDVCNNTYEWCSEGITSHIDELQGVPLSIMPEWVETHRKGEIMYIQDVFSLPEENGTRQVLEPHGVKSLIALPLMNEKECIGFVGFDSVRHHHEYSLVEKMLLSVFAELLVNIRTRTILENNLIKEKINAESANRAKSEFLANMSHEIRTPMNSILGFSEVMLNSVTNNKHKGYLNTILSSGKTLLSLINDILDLSKIEAGRLEISSEPVNVKAILFEMQQIFIQKVEEKGIDFFTEIDPELPANITIDEIRLRQILLNLIGNAVKFTSSGFVKVIAESVSEDHGIIDLSISVLDSGIGIPELDQARIFESFSQQSGQDSRKYGGTGLGLAITKRLCELMDGEITLESKPDKGSKFTVTFSNVKYSEDVIHHDDGFKWDENRIVFKSAKVMIVDDIPHNRNLVLSYLEKSDLTLYEAENGEIAINNAKEYMPDLILMDIRMPGINGYQATETLKNDSKTQKIPVIALTASTMHSETDNINDLFDGYLRKPIQKQHLVNEMAKFLDHDILDESVIAELEAEQDQSIAEVITDKMKDSFKEKFFDKIEYLKDVMIIDEVNDFSDNIVLFAEENQLRSVKSLGEKLKIDVSEFDFDKISSDFQKLIKLFE